MDLQLTGRRALVTGASRGIGRAIAKSLAAEGARVAICARGQEGVDLALAELRALGVEAYGESIDLRDNAALEGFVSRVATQFGGLDLVVSNVSTRPEAPQGEARWRQAFEADLLHHVRLTDLTVPFLLKGQQPSLVFLASIAANMKQLMPEEVAYGAFKAALVNYAGHLSERYGRKGLRVNTVSPSPIYFKGGAWDVFERENPKMFEAVKAMTPLGRFGTPQEVANAVAFLLSPVASYITGVNLRIDGGMLKTTNF